MMKEQYLFIELLSIENGKAYGFQEFAFNLLDYFYQHREDLVYDEVVLAVKEGERNLFERYSDKFCIVGFHYSNLLQRHYVQMMLPLKLKVSKDDVLFAPGNYSGLIKRCTTVLTVHDLLFKRKAWLPNRMMRWQRQLYIPMSLRHADKIVAISQFTADDIAHFYPHQSEGKVEVVRNYFNFSKFRATPTKKAGDYFLAVSSNGFHKNLVTVIRAFESYVGKGGTQKLILVGKVAPDTEAGKAIAALSPTAKALLDIRTQVSNEALGELYQKAGCYITASLFEGLGMPIVEAMSFNLPVLVTDDSVFREVSLGQGDYFNPLDADELTDKMLQCDMRKRDYSNQIMEAYSETNTSAQYVRIFNELAAKRGG